jgi:galactokinase/mevalonate kinase-like predicted kinase
VIISRTPFRVSFFGGGTDYPVWFERGKGAVLVTTIWIENASVPFRFERHGTQIIVYDESSRLTDAR